MPATHTSDGSAGYRRDANARAYFQKHKPELDALFLSVSGESTIQFVAADWAGYGSDAKDQKHIACSLLLKKIGAQFLRQDGGDFEVYFWGKGCAVCHDSFKGFAHIKSLPSFLKKNYAKVVDSLSDDFLPRGKYAPVEDGTYLVPIGDDWYLIRWECG